MKHKGTLIHTPKRSLRRSKPWTFTTFAVLLPVLFLLSVALSLSLGQVRIPFSLTYRIVCYKLSGLLIGDSGDLNAGSFMNIIWQIRFPRVLTAMLVGAGLSLCGTLMQASVKNPLADPYILGISSGASLGATFAILIGFGAAGLFSQIRVAAGAFIGAFGASMAVLTLAGMGGYLSSIKLVLSGMVINALCNAFSNFIIYFANNAEGIKTVTFWTMGSLASSKWEKLPLLSVLIGAAFLFGLSQFRVLNALLLGDEAAVTLGINITAYRRLYMVSSSLITGVMVAYCGMIGFVGLIVPHILRGIVGSDHRRLLPAAVLTGALFLLWADLIARIVLAGTEIPIGIITALIGAPVFVTMLVKKDYGFGRN
ncbi:MAG: iron ABC transporter permease [Spirochaetaceae bacterium]|jgi:iron complex transport system permease protein|nr:iron ABC transporter permease [Spirochaetaceae bacterium]